MCNKQAQIPKESEFQNEGAAMLKLGGKGCADPRIGKESLKVCSVCI